MKLATSTLVVFALVALAGCQKQAQSPAEPGGQACTREAKVCPDGSSVGRTGPNCEFAECPGAKDSPDGTPGDGQSSPPVPTEDDGPDDEL